MKPDQPSECTNCSCQERWLLHNVRLREVYHRLCTSCVLKLHPGLFCPVCFEVYEGGSLPVDRVMCLRCSSVPHSSCVAKEVASCYICPPCLNPNFVFFSSGSLSLGCRNVKGETFGGGDRGAIDVKTAKVLVAAAHIASISMSKAAGVAKMEAEKKVREAASARKRARDALQRVSDLAFAEKAEGRDLKVVDRVGMPMPLPLAEQQNKFKATNDGGVSPVMEQKPFANHIGRHQIEAGGALPSNNIVHGDKDRVLAGFCPPKAVQRGGTSNGVSFEDRNKLKGSIPLVADSPRLPKIEPATGFSRNNIAQGEKEKNGLLSAPPALGTLQHLQKGEVIGDPLKAKPNN
ncbi:hypothetical protein Sjap_007155 [Stephania japonica]|uniref:RING-type domain-containing protein n=1 Tax=Stephania japonica TaxID=461633 RepID=A0AAP0JN16_9MAGN